MTSSPSHFKWKTLFHFPIPFFQVFTPIWLISCLVLIAFDLGTKKLITENLNYYLGYHQAKWLPKSNDLTKLKAVARTSHADGQDQINIWGDNGKYIKFRLVFNDRFVFGLGPSRPILGFSLSLLATCFLILYRWRNVAMGHPIAWLLVFAGAFGNLIDKLFMKSLNTREWIFSLVPQEGHITGVVDFIECIWFGWENLSGYPILSLFSLTTWPTFNVADSMIVVGIVCLLLTLTKETKKKHATR